MAGPWTGCATGPRVNTLSQIPPLTDLSSHRNPEAIRALTGRIQELTQRLRASSDAVRGQEYDHILAELSTIVRDYKVFLKASRITSTRDVSLHIPPKSKITMDFKTYCLAPHAAAPADEEPYVLTRKDPGIQLFKEIMAYTHLHPGTPQSEKQRLLWNIKNEVKFEDLPVEQQALLLKITPTAYLRLNNSLKAMAADRIRGLVDRYVPGAGQVRDAYALIRGRAYPYEEYARSIERLKSRFQKPAGNLPSLAEGYELYTQVQPHGFSSATVTFYNTTNTQQDVHSYFKPLRSDIQPLAFDIPELQDFYDALITAFGELIGALAQRAGFKLGPGDQVGLDQNADKLLGLWKAYGDKNNAFEVTANKFGGNGEDDASDAFRHAYWNSLMVRDVGESLAKDIATNHELNPGTPESRQMDLWNNQLGRDVGKSLNDLGVKDDEAYANEVLKNRDRWKVLR
jgi:hypothetical protein